MLYDQTFHVRDRARDPTTFGLELSACTTPEKAIERVLACYKEGLRDPDPHIRGIHIDRLLCTMPAERIIMRQVGRESYMSKLIKALRDGRMFEGSCGLCEHFGFTPQYDRDCWEIHPMGSEQYFTATNRQYPNLRILLLLYLRQQVYLSTHDSRCEKSGIKNEPLLD
jgi:hypothetical protein